MSETKFDHYATPMCDELAEHIPHLHENCHVECWKDLAENIEQRAIRVEEKLRVIEMYFIFFQHKHNSADVAQLLNQIERELELKGLSPLVAKM